MITKTILFVDDESHVLEAVQSEKEFRNCRRIDSRTWDSSSTKRIVLVIMVWLSGENNQNTCN
ncbi:MAG: hypothetical protein KJ985_08910 [Proteobacteria bacterium]|nr:hypothetical protein [Pseudomonadota bacterium]